MEDKLAGRRGVELVVPGVAVGLLAGVVAGGAAILGGLGGGYAVVTLFTLGLPLAVFGIGYNLLLAIGKIRLGGVAPAALYWLVCFPLARLVHEVTFDVVSGQAVTLPDALFPFLAFQAILSVGYAIGFIWLHEYVFSYWWIRIRDHNPVAERYVEQYKRQATTMARRKQAMKDYKKEDKKN